MDYFLLASTKSLVWELLSCFFTVFNYFATD